MDIDVTLLSIVIIVLLYVPGFFFKRFYYTGKFVRQFTAGVFAERVITSIFWGIIIQIISIWLVDKFLDCDYSSIRKNITSFYQTLEKKEMPECSANSFNYATGYIGFTILIAMFLGATCHYFVRLFRLDIKFPVFRFANYWQYYFKGEFISAYNKIVSSQRVISADVDIVIDDGTDRGRLYKGFLSEYTLSVNGELETIALTGTERWSNSSNGFVSIPGDCFIIPYSKVLNFNLRYNVQRQYVPKTNDIFAILMLSLLPAILFLLPYYFYSEIGLLRIILAVVAAIASWFLLMALVFGVFFSGTNSNSTTQPLTGSQRKGVIIVFAFLILLTGYCSYKIVTWSVLKKSGVNRINTPLQQSVDSLNKLQSIKIKI